jgi:hypothetical protein
MHMLINLLGKVRSACLKSSYYTNSKYVKKSIPSFDKLLDAVRKARRDLYPRIDHVFIQGMKQCPTEVKLVFIGGVFSHVTSSYSKAGPTIGINPSNFKPYHPSKDKPFTHYLLLV